VLPITATICWALCAWHMPYANHICIVCAEHGKKDLYLTCQTCQSLPLVLLMFPASSAAQIIITNHINVINKSKCFQLTHLLTYLLLFNAYKQAVDCWRHICETATQFLARCQLVCPQPATSYLCVCVKFN
jgi:hypothetical protein